jgi:hypothetical protein
MLGDAGAEGVHSFQFVEAYMPRVAAVIHKLREDGYDITSTRETWRGKSKGVRYVLVACPAGETRADRPVEPGESVALFAQRPANPYESEAA